jgi:hypothetical protein
VKVGYYDELGLRRFAFELHMFRLERVLLVRLISATEENNGHTSSFKDKAPVPKKSMCPNIDLLQFVRGCNFNGRAGGTDLDTRRPSEGGCPISPTLNTLS